MQRSSWIPVYYIVEVHCLKHDKLILFSFFPVLIYCGISMVLIILCLVVQVISQGSCEICMMLNIRYIIIFLRINQII